MSMKGIDISTFQGKDNDFTKAKKSGIDFVILRAGYGRELTQKDDCFETNYKKAKEAGLKVGAYWFSYADSSDDAKKEAKTCLQCIKGKTFDLPIFFDLELDWQFNKGKAFCESLITSFCDTITSNGYKSGLYMSYSPLMSLVSKNVRDKYPLWIAQYNSKCQYDGKYAIWQYSDKGKVNGFNGNIDMDILYDTSILKNNTSKNNTSVSSNSTNITSKVSDKDKLLEQAKKYLGCNGYYVCKDKLHLDGVYDWCAFSISSIMKDCGFIGKYIKQIEGGAGSIPRESDDKYGKWFLKSQGTPQAGDLILFRYGGSYTDKYHSDHIGIVEKVFDNSITTLEGNVDGDNSNWAATSEFKRKVRLLNSSNVYAFYRPYWNGNKSNNFFNNTNSKNNSIKIDSSINVTYQAFTKNYWLDKVTNYNNSNENGYAGIEQSPIQGIKMKPSKGSLSYRVHTIGSNDYLPWVTDFNDYAGLYGKNIDKVQIKYNGDNNYVVKYRVSLIDTPDYLPWVTDYNNTNGNGYAGISGMAIDKIQICIVRK